MTNGIGNLSMPNFGNYSTASLPWQSSAFNGGMFSSPFTFGSSSRSSASKDMTTDEYNKKEAEQYKKSMAAYRKEKNDKRQKEIENGPTDKEWEILAGEYAKGLAPSESLAGTLKGSLIMLPIFGAGKLKNIRAGKSGKVFEGIKVAGSYEQKLYSTTRGKKIITEASEALKSLENMATRKGTFLSTCDKRTYVEAKQLLENALATKDSKVIAAATEQVKQAAGVNNGWIARTWRRIQGVPEPNIKALLEDSTTAAATAEKTLAAKTTGSLSQRMLKGAKGHAKGAAFMAALEVVMHIPDMITAFKKDSKTGWKQVGQTTVKAAGNAIGWIAGEAAASAAAGALLGSVAPGIGTAIGFVVGMIGGTIGCWLAGRATKALVGDDVANQVKAEQMLAEENNKSNPNDAASVQQTGKYQLIQNAVAMHGQQKASPEVEKILRKYQYIT